MKIFKKIIKYSIWSISIIVILITAIFIFIQTELFNKWALDLTLSTLNNSETWLKKENFITVESINGNILKGLRVNNIVVTVKKDTLASIKYLDLKYDIWGLLKQKIGVEYIVINSPEINIVKIKSDSDSLIWNFSNLFSPSTDTTPASQFNWNIYVNSLKVEDGKIKVLGEIPPEPLWALHWEKQDEFEFNKLDISGFQLDMAGEYSQKIRKVNLLNLSFNSNTDVIFKKLSFDANINISDTLTEINNFELLTDRSDIKIKSFTAEKFNPLDSNAFSNYENKKVSIMLDLEKFDFDDVKFLLPDVDMLGSVSALHLNANGTLKDMNVNNLAINLPDSYFNLKGNVKNIDNVDSMYLDITSSFKINPADIKTVYNSKSIPDFENLGIVTADIDYSGRYFDFYSIYDIRSASGNIKGQGHLNINDDYYDGNIVTNNLNLSQILNNKKLKSNINIDARFEGRGFSPNSMSAGVKYTLRNSSFAGYNLSSSSGTININKNNISLNIRANSPTGNAVVSGKINISNLRNPVYSFKGNVNKVDISGLTRNSSDKSNLNAVFDIDGRGINPNNLSGRYDIKVGDSFYSEYNIPGTNLNARLSVLPDSSSVHLNNKAMELKADGTFNIYSLIDAVLYNISLVSNIAAKKLNPDSSFTNTDLPEYKNKENFNFNYSLITKDSSELKKITTPFGMILNGDFSGSMSNSVDRFNVNSVFDIKNFRYKDTTVIIRNLKSGIALTNEYEYSNKTDPLSSFKINMDVNADKIKINSYKFDSIKAELKLSEAVTNLKINGKLDSQKYIRMASEIDLRGGEIVMRVDSLYAKYLEYNIENNDKWTLVYIPQKEIKINQLGLKSGKMVLNIKGVYSLNGESDINMKGENMDIGEIYTMLNPFDTTLSGEKNIYPVQGELRDFVINVKGTPEDVNITLDVKTNILKSDTTGMGTIVANVKYKGQVITPEILITNVQGNGSLKITGNIPLKNPLVIRDSTSAVALDIPAEVHLEADNFQIQYFTKLVPGLGDIRGVLKGNLDATGTYQNPELKGSLTMERGKYFLGFTGMYYDYKFKISTENSNLIIDYLSIYNPEDDSRHIDVFGNIDFKNYNLNDIRLTTSGDMVMLDKNARENKLNLKGHLLGGIGNPPITISGNLKKLNIKGQLLIKDASIASMPNSGKGYQVDDKNMIYILANDTVMTSDSNKKKVSLVQYRNINPFYRDRYLLIDTVKEFSISDILLLDLSVKTVKNLYVSIDFNNLTRDRLFGEVSADLRIRSDSGRLRTRGEVNIVGNSYYRFYRDFKVKDSKIVFRGQIGNPELDIRAVYENTKSTEQFGTVTSSPIQVILTVTGNPTNPEITLKLYENGTEMLGNEATSDAITFLLFGKYKNELSASETQSVASGIGSTVGSLYATSFFGQAVRSLLPFVKDAELNYSEGGIQNTSVNVSTNILNADITVGSRVIENNTYLEFNVEYPLSELVHLNLPEQIYLRLAREQLSRNVISNSNVYYSTGMKFIYKLKF